MTQTTETRRDYQQIQVTVWPNDEITFSFPSTGQQDALSRTVDSEDEAVTAFRRLLRSCLDANREFTIG